MKSGPNDDVTLEGEVHRVTFQNIDTGFRIVQVKADGAKSAIAVIGNFPEVRAGSRVRVRGKRVVDEKYGEQIKAETVLELLPSTLKGMERYLGSGIVPGVGRGFAKRVVEHFGLSTMRVLDEQPERLGEVQGLGDRRAETIARHWKQHLQVRDVMVFLEAHGASGALATRIFKRYGTEASTIVSREPYRLAIEVTGVGFRTADKIAAGIGVLPNATERLQAGVLQALSDASEDGHTALPKEMLLERSLALLPRGDYQPEQDEIERAITALLLRGFLQPGIGNDGSDSVLSLRHLHAAEKRMAARMFEIAHAKANPLSGVDEAILRFERDKHVQLAPAQRAAIAAAAAHPVLLLTGGPGVGKTTIVRTLLALFKGANLTVRLAAPTGRAAKRLSESTQQEATTLHRLLEFEPRGARFLRNDARPIEGDVVIVDEASMIDVILGDALLQAVSPSTRFVLVGDVDQLPSVGPGAVLRDLLDSRLFSSVRLQQIFRQDEASLIVKNAHRINNGEMPQKGEGESDFFIIERKTPEEAKQTLLEVVCERIPKRFGLDPVNDIQVLTPMHKGAIGAQALNEELQARLNPHGKAIEAGFRQFRVGDKVMQLRNNYDKEVWNGDVGRITSFDEEEAKFEVSFDEGRIVSYETNAADELTLAYACTVHKSQGSEYSAVVIPVSTAHFVMLTRNLIYTAVTRGKRLVVLIADPRAMSLALAEKRRGERFTQLLPALLEGEQRGFATPAEA